MPCFFDAFSIFAFNKDAYMKKTFLSLILLVTGTLALQAFDRGMGNPKSVYIPKGTVSANLTFGYNNWKASGENDESGVSLAGLVSQANGDVTLVKLSAGAAWFFRDNLSVGVRFGYGTTQVDVNHLEILSLLNLSNQHVRRQTYSAALAVRGYLPLFDSKVVALFGEGRLTGSIGYGKNYEITDRGKEGTYSDLLSVRLGLYPGISVFLTNAVAFELSLPLIEGGLQWDKQIKGQAHDSEMSRTFLNFKPGLTGINAGIVLHF